MNKATIRQRTKVLAKSVLFSSFVKVVFVIILIEGTSLLLSMLFSELSDRLFGSYTISLWIFNFDLYASILLLFGSIFALPLELGAAEYFLRLVRRKEPKISDIFLWFADGERLKTVLSYFLWTAIIYVLAIPAFTMPTGYILEEVRALFEDILKQAESGATSIVVNYSLIDWKNTLLSLAIIGAYFLFTCRFMALPYLLVDDFSIGGIGAARKSWKLMKGHTFEYMVFALSFAGWYIGAAFTAGMLAFYAVPYFTLGKVIFAEYIRADKNINARVSEESPA